MNKQLSMLIALLFGVTAFGLNSVMFSELVYEMAVSAGLSHDEVELVKIGFTVTQLLGFLLSPLIIRYLGAYLPLRLSLLVGGVANLVLYLQMPFQEVFIISWFFCGFFMGMLLVIINFYLLDAFSEKWLPLVIALTLVFSTLIPMGAYPWVFAKSLEFFDWPRFFLVSAWLYFSALVIVSLFTSRGISLPVRRKSNFRTYLVVGTALSLLVYILMRGSYHNWLDSTFYSQLVVVTSVFLLLALYVIIRAKQRNTASIQLHNKLKTNVFMYNAFLAGFAVIVSSVLFINFLKMTLHYNNLNAGYMQLQSFYAMLIGMMVSVLVFYFRRPLADAVVPLGVFMILLSVHKFSLLPNTVGPESLVMPLFLRGFGVGMLNVSVTLAVLMHFKEEERLEGIANFYLFRTMGGVIGGSFLSHTIQSNSAKAASDIGYSVIETNYTFTAYQNAFADAVLTYGNIPTKQLITSKMSLLINEQVTVLALSSSLTVFIFSIFVLAPILLISKKIASKRDYK